MHTKMPCTVSEDKRLSPISNHLLLPRSGPGRGRGQGRDLSSFSLASGILSWGQAEGACISIMLLLLPDDQETREWPSMV